MGLFDFLSRRSTPPPADGGQTVPRCDHYSFTHVVLRDAAFSNPVHTVTALASPEAGPFIEQLWEQVVTACQEHQQRLNIEPRDILVHKIRVGAFPCALVEMPTPQFPTEAFFIALVLAVTLSDEEVSFDQQPLRYFTLEHAGGDDNQLQTVMGEWRSNQSHVKHGPGPYPDLDEFVKRVSDLAVAKRIN